PRASGADRRSHQKNHAAKRRKRKKQTQEKNLPFEEVRDDGVGRIVVTTPDSTKDSDIVAELKSDFGPGWSVDEHGKTVVATMDEAAQNEQRDRATDMAKTIIENRVNAFGVTEPTVQRQGGQGTYQILVQMPGVDDPERVKNTLNADSNLELKLVAKGTQVPFPTKDAAEGALKTQPGGEANYEVKQFRGSSDEGGAGREGWVVVEKTAVVTGLEMRAAEARQSQYGGNNYEIDFQLAGDAATRFGDTTGKHIGDSPPIVLNDEVKSAPTIQGQIPHRGHIPGNFTKK